MERHVHVRLLVSEWAHSLPDLARFVLSLTALNGGNQGRVRVEGKMFQVSKNWSVTWAVDLFPVDDHIRK